MHTTMIVLHAAAGTVALVAGPLAFSGRRRALDVHLPALVLMQVGLTGAVVVGWSTDDTGGRVLLSALLVLGLVVVGRGFEARWRRPAPGEPGGGRYRAAIGFTVVALVDAFLVVSVMDLGAPVSVVAGTGVGVAVVGHLVLRDRIARGVPIHPGVVRSPAPAPR